MLKRLYRRKYQVFTGLSILYVIVSLFCIELTVTLFTDYHTRSVKDDIESRISAASSSFEASVYHDIYVADSLSTMVTIDPQFSINHWDAIAEKIVTKARSVRNIVLAPNDVMSYVYPLQGNEKVLGVSYLTLPEQIFKVTRARDKKEMILDGPVNLVQGGTGLIARYPIFSDSPHNENYWGIISVVLDYDKLVAQSGLLDILGANIALVKSISDSSVLIFGDQDTVVNAELTIPINLPNNNWTLCASYQTDYLIEDSPQIVTIARMAAIVIFLGIYFLLALLFRSYLGLFKNSIQDELTKLPNRRFILNQLDRIALKSDINTSFSILSLDMNDFKLVNDDYGHEAGDALLQHVAKQLSISLGSSATISRFGGDEFIVVLPKTSDVIELKKIITKLHKHFENQPLFWNGLSFIPSLSIGYAVHSGLLSHEGIRQLLARADKKMYEDKRHNQRYSS